MEIYAPLAHRLGMQRIKWELEDLSLKYLDPVGYHEIETAAGIPLRRPSRSFWPTPRPSTSRSGMEQEGIHCTVYGRIKHIYSIYRKMYTQNKTLDEIFDLYAFRVIVDDIADCYNVLGCIHDMFKPGARPVQGLYLHSQAQHATSPCTPPSSARRAFPSRCRSAPGRCTRPPSTALPPTGSTRQGVGNEKLDSEATYEWVRKLLESQQDTDAEEFVRSMQGGSCSPTRCLCSPPRAM